jgi:hypothetical protein
METANERTRRILFCVPGLMLCAVWIVGEIAAVIYWAVAGEIWLMLGSGAIPMFGALTLIFEILAG